MQTIAIQNTPAATPQPAKNAPAPNDDFKQALSRELDRAPVCHAPEPTTAAPAKQPAKAPKPAQNANQAASQPAAPDTADAAASAAAAPAQDGAPATAAATPAQPAETDPAADDAAAAAAAAPADMLAMLAAYQQLTATPQAKADAPAETTDPAATDGAQLTALQTDAAGKRPALELDTKADANGEPKAAKPETDGTSVLQQAHADKAAADQLAKLGDEAPHAQLTTEQKAEAFATKLAEANAQPQPVLPQAAQALATTAQAAQAAAATQLQARVGTNAWEQQLGQKVVWMVAGGDQSASLTLNPPDLGPLQVVLNVSNDSATATFTAAQPETRQAIENALPKLREMMSEAGIALGNATVSAGTQDQQGAFAEQARAAGGGGRRFGNAVDGAPPEAPQPVVRQTVLGAVDTFA